MTTTTETQAMCERLDDLGSRRADETALGRIGSYIDACQKASVLLTRQQEEIERLTLGHASLFSYLVGLKMKEDPTMTLGDAEAIILAALQAKP